MSENETIELFMSLFRGRTDCWGSVSGKSNKEPVTLENYRLHLEGKVSLGIYPLLDNGMINFFAVDLDEKNFAKAVSIRNELNNLGVKMYVCQSKSKGFHVYGFGDGPLIAKNVREMLARLLIKLNIQCEVFPKQDKLDEIIKYGNYINLPCFGDTRPFLTADQQPISTEQAIKLIQRNSQEMIDKATQVLPPIPSTMISVKTGQKGKGKQTKSKTANTPPCIERILAGVDSGMRDEAAFALARHFLDDGNTVEATFNRLKNWDSKNKPPLNDEGILRTKIESAQCGYAFGCKSIRDNPLLAPFCLDGAGCDWLENSPSARFPSLVDIAEGEGQVVYLILQNGQLETTANYYNGTAIVHPPGKVSIPFQLPRAANVIKYYRTDNDAILFQDINNYLKDAAELPSQLHYDLITYWILHTYLYERFPYSPYIAFVGPPERGKSRTGRAMASIAYRGIETETMREANLFRWSNDLGATIFLDVMDIWRKAERERSEDILLKRFERGGKVGRVLYPEKGPFEDTVYFDIYGPTIIATNEVIHHILSSRCIPITMSIAKNKVWNELSGDKALELKERCVAFRARHMESTLPEFPKPPYGRLGDIIQPLGIVMVLVSPDKAKDFDKFVKGLWAERREDKSRTKEARIIKAVTEIYNGEDWVSISAVTDKYNEGKQPNYTLSTDSMGRCLKNIGFKGSRNNGTRGVTIEPETLTQLSVQYGLIEPEDASQVSSVKIEPIEG